MYNNTPGPTGNGQWNPANKQQSPPGALEQSPQWPYANNPPPDQQILLGPFDASSPWPYANNQQGQQVPQDNTQWPYASNGQMPPAAYDNSYPRTPSRLLPGLQGQQAPQDNGLQWPYANNQQGQQAYANNGQGQQPYDNYARNGSRGLLSGSNQQVYNPAAQPTLMPGQFVYDPPISSGRGLAPSRHSKGWFNDQNRQARTIVTGGIIIFLLLIGFGAAAIYGNHPQAPTVPPVSTLTTAPTIIPTATTLLTPTPTTAPTPTAQPTQPPPTPTPRSIPTTVPTQRPVATATPVALPTMTATPVKVPTATPPGKTPIVSGTPGHP